MQVAKKEEAFALSGHVDGRLCPEMRQALYDHIESQEGDVVVDLSGVESIDGTVLRMLGAAAVRLERVGRHLVLRGTPPTLRRILASGHWRRLFRSERTTP